MPIIELKKSNINLWDEYPDLDLIEEFRKLRADEGDDRSNNILKAIYYIWDPKSDKRDSGFSEEELVKDITKNLIADKAFKWTKYEKIKQAWFKYCLTKTDTQVKYYQDEIDALHEMLENWTWAKDNAADKAAVMKIYKGLLDDLKDVLILFAAEKAERQEMEGNYTLSLLEERQDGDSN